MALSSTKKYPEIKEDERKALAKYLKKLGKKESSMHLFKAKK